LNGGVQVPQNVAIRAAIYAHDEVHLVSGVQFKRRPRFKRGCLVHCRGGDRQGNSALGRIVMVRMANDPTTQAYVELRTNEGKSKPEIIRCLIG
jgi:ribosomal protein S12